MAYVNLRYRSLVVIEYLYVREDEPSVLRKGSVNIWTSVEVGRSLRDMGLREFHLSFPSGKCVLMRFLHPSGKVFWEVWPREGKKSRSIITRFANLLS